MVSSFGTRMTPLKWDAAAWRHFPDSPLDARFLEELEKLRKPPSNLSLKKYIDCVRIGALRAYRHQHGAEKAHVAQAFWNQMQKKVPALVLSDDIPTLLPDVQGMPISAAPLAAAAWQNLMIDTMTAAQRNRPIYRLPSHAQQALLAVRSWERLNSQEPPIGIERAASWLRVYVAIRVAAAQSSAGFNPALLDQWNIELESHSAENVATIASHLCRNPEWFGSAVLREASFLALVHLAENAISAADVATTLAVGGAALDSAPTWASSLVPPLDACVTEYSLRCPDAPLLVVLGNTGWKNGNVYEHWRHLSEPARRAQAETVLHYLLEHAHDLHCFPDEDAIFWAFMEQELRALRPWGHELVEKVAFGIPAMACCKSIALGLDPDMDIVQTLGGPWLPSWRQMLMHRGMPVESVSSEVFADAQTDMLQ